MPELALSIVGERLLKQAQHDAETLWASPADTDDYVDSASAAVLACRETMRHLFPTLAELKGKPLDFIGVNELGLLMREPLNCKRCKLAYREELYEVQGRGKNARLVRVAAITKYHDGYLLKGGQGRMTSSMIRESLATKSMGGLTPTQLKKKAQERGVELAAQRAAAAEKHRAEVRAS
jgi:hypothetical protein